MLRRLRKDQKGFTLMEIVIVIVILGILALLAIPRLLGFTDQAKIANDKEYAAVVGRAAELYAASHDGVITPVGSGTVVDVLTGADLVDTPSEALQYFTAAASSVTVTISTGSTSQSGTGGGTLDKGIALVVISDGATTPEQIIYSSQYGYTTLP